MKNIMINKWASVAGKVLLAVVLLTVMAQSAFAVTDRTWITNASGGQIAAGGNCRYIAYYKGSDDYLQTEDSWNSVPGYANSNAGYTLGGSPAKGYCDTNSSYYPDPDPASTDTYDIWISSIADGQAGHGNGTVGAVSPSYIPAGNSNYSQLYLDAANYLAEPSNVRVSSGDGRIVISWNAVAGATGYKVYRGPVGVLGSGTGIYQRIADTSNLFTEDTSVANGTTYFYIVFAYDALRRGVHTDQQSAVPDATGAPSITQLNPTSGPVGASVTITGSDFGSSQGMILFNGVEATIISWDNSQIIAQVPAGATTGNVYVINSSNKASNGVNFTVMASGSKDYILRSTANGNFNWIALAYADTGLATTTDLAASIGNTIPAGSRNAWVDVVEVRMWDAANQQEITYSCIWDGSSWNDSGVNAPLTVGSMYKVTVPAAANGLTWSIAGTIPAPGSVQFTLNNVANGNYNWITTPAYTQGMSTTTDLAASIGNTIPAGSRNAWVDVVEVRAWDAANQQEITYSCIWDGSTWNDNGNNSTVNVPDAYVVSVPAITNGNIWP